MSESNHSQITLTSRDGMERENYAFCVVSITRYTMGGHKSLMPMYFFEECHSSVWHFPSDQRLGCHEGIPNQEPQIRACRSHKLPQPPKALACVRKEGDAVLLVTKGKVG
jgi:hypothetical protein